MVGPQGLGPVHGVTHGLGIGAPKEAVGDTLVLHGATREEPAGDHIDVIETSIMAVSANKHILVFASVLVQINKPSSGLM